MNKKVKGWVCSKLGGGERSACSVLLRKPERKRQFGSTRHVWEDNIKIYLQEIRRGHGLDACGSG